MADMLSSAYPCSMKNNDLPQNQKPSGTPQPAAPVPSSQNEINFTPSSDEIARKAYFAFVNQGSQSGHEVQHWLDAEAQLIAERNRNRVHHFHHWDLK
jgi:hypothetical protein